MKDSIPMKKEFQYFIESLLGWNSKLDVNLFHLDNMRLVSYQQETIHSDSLLFILVLSGNVNVKINFKRYEILANDLILLSQGHFFELEHVSLDFSCILFHIGKDYINEMYSTEMLYKRTKYNVRMYKLPQIHLKENEVVILKKRLSLVSDEIENINHIHQKELILLSIRIFFIELSVIIENRSLNKTEKTPLSRDEIYFQKFLDILSTHYQREHLVDFYARKLHITPHYLTIIVKRLTGQTVSDIIFQLIFSEAKLLLQNPDITIQQIAEQLHFADQSTFGKFFKRRSGVSPMSYRKLLAL